MLILEGLMAALMKSIFLTEKQKRNCDPLRYLAQSTMMNYLRKALKMWKPLFLQTLLMKRNSKGQYDISLLMYLLAKIVKVIKPA